MAAIEPRSGVLVTCLTPATQIGPNTHCLPLFVIAGAWKCGTTSLWSAMGSHPSALHPKQKELRVFGTAASGKVRPHALCARRCSRLLPLSAALMSSSLRQQVTPKQYASMFPPITHPTHFTYESSPSAWYPHLIFGTVSFPD